MLKACSKLGWQFGYASAILKGLFKTSFSHQALASSCNVFKRCISKISDLLEYGHY